MLELAGVYKTFGGVRAIAPLSLRIAAGSTSVLIGQSGCGKSTLLRLMIGLIPPDAGEVRLEGELLAPPGLLALRRRMGYVIQDGGLFPHLTAGENVGLMARYLEWPRERIRARLDELADLTRFPPQGLARYPTHLSGGQ